MQIPDGYGEYCVTYQNKKIYSNIHCVKLQKTLYGLVQFTRQWWKKFKDVMKSIDYIPSPADPCLLINTSTNKSFHVTYADDGDIFSTKENIDTLIQALSKDFKVKYLGKLENFVGCHIIEN
jgi:Reverse transcriptase (RNA-dependent DNA polymerase)